MCVGDVEHINSFFVDRKYVKESCQAVGLDFNSRAEEHAHVWLHNMLSKAPDDTLIKISTVLWSIWFAQNKQIFESKNLPPAVGISRSKEQIVEWREANKKTVSMQNTMENRTAGKVKWKPP